MDDEYSPLLTVGKMEQLVYLFSTASWTDFPCVYLAFFRSSARYVSCTGDHAAMGRNYRGSFFSTFFDLRDGKQLGYVHTGAGANAVKYNPKYNELYVTNFTSGTISVVDATKYSITREFNMPVYPNQMVLSDDMDTLYIGIKEGFNRDWDPDVFVEGAKERILSIDLKKS